ncbi:Os06g0610100 [Oryza sativa Japonica Group]|uniref:Carbonic anhydrase n=1 Tax=Oryza sativa subsp. japonica TaxID=39947 RepID=C7J4A9_ORYSJ|nr:Os06g0610100 [Oryza sativa Japonica Group]|eukprot:NP_001174896.1 Os06g0610100 [Oryza sativa Japonica Group]
MHAPSNTNGAVVFLAAAVSFLLLLLLGSIRHARAQQETGWSSATVAATTTGRSGGGTSGGIGPPAPSASAAANPPSASPRPPPSPPAAAAATTAAASLVNRGHDIMVRFDGDAGGVVVDGETYALRQMHWHSPSEHAVDGRRYDLELHMLHQSETRDGRYAVVAQLFDIGHRRDATLDMVITLCSTSSTIYT